MDLTKEMVRNFKGGQVLIKSATNSNLYRGEIKSLYVCEGNLVIELKWMATWDGSCPKKWVKRNEIDYQVKFAIYSINEIGPGFSLAEGQGGLRIVTKTGEQIIIFLPNTSGFSFAQVWCPQIGKIDLHLEYIYGSHP